MTTSPKGLKKGLILQGGKYRIEKILGSGSFGITYLATAKFTTQGNLGQMEVEGKVAIKEFFMSEVNARKEDGSTVEGSTGSVFTNYRKKFRKEAENLSKLAHPNIVEVFDVFDENNTTYYVMKFLEGQNLDDYVKQQGHLKEQEAISITNEIGSALEYMHATKMLHLDIKPKNIMRTSDGKYYLIDFGLSKQFTDTGEPESSTSIGLGTPGYAPIEQTEYKKDSSFPATLDVYALAATLFKMLSGERPPEATYILNEGFPAERLTEVGVSAHTLHAVEKGMSPMRKQRFQSVRAFLNELVNPEIEEVTIVEEPIKPKPQPSFNPKPQPQPKPKDNPQPKPQEPTISKPTRYFGLKLSGWAIILIALVIIGLIYLLTERSRENKPADSSPFDPTTLPLDSIMEKVPETDTDMQWESPLGSAVYSGEIMNDTLATGEIRMIPNGNGVAKIDEEQEPDKALFAGAIYDGDFVAGVMEGQATYTLSNGDVFTGTFHRNQFDEGKYLDSESGEYFVGTFRDMQPYEGKWYSSDGKVIEEIK